MLVARWRILRDGLNFSVRRCSTAIAVTMELHKFCQQQDRRGYQRFRELDGVKDAL